MKPKDFFMKFVDKMFWANIAAMIVVVVLLVAGVGYALNVYTFHGRSVKIPDLKGMMAGPADKLMQMNNLKLVVSDTGYNKRLPPDCILMQTPEPGTSVKQGRVVYVVINSATSPTVSIPDIIDNSSVREAEARLKAMGFILLEPKIVTGEKDWVYGISQHGKLLATGDKVAVGSPLTLHVGGGTYDEDSEDINIMESSPMLEQDESADADEFVEVSAPPASETNHSGN